MESALFMRDRKTARNMLRICKMLRAFLRHLTLL